MRVPVARAARRLLAVSALLLRSLPVRFLFYDDILYYNSPLHPYLAALFLTAINNTKVRTRSPGVRKGARKPSWDRSEKPLLARTTAVGRRQPRHSDGRGGGVERATKRVFIDGLLAGAWTEKGDWLVG